MATNLGRKHSCYSCHTKFYDLGKPQAVCPKCGADQRDAETAAPTSSRSRRAAPVPVEVVPEEDFDTADDAGDTAEDEDEDTEAPAVTDDEDEDEEEEEE